MKYFHMFFFTLVFSFFIYAIGYGQNFAVAHNQNSGGSPQSPEDLVVIHYDGDNAGNSVGDGGTTFIGGARFRASIMGQYTGGELLSVQFFYAQASTGLTIMIYDAGTASEPGALLLSQPLDLGSLTLADWNEVALSSSIPISGNDLWVCLQVEDATGNNFPFGVDAGPADPDGDWVNDSGTWQHLVDFGLNYNWNIRGVVQTPTIVTIAYAREDLNNDYVPDHLGDTLTVQGVVISPNYQTVNISYFIDDGTGGIDLFHAGSTSPTLNLGDEVMVTGQIQQFNGVTEIVPADTTDITVVSTGNPVPSPIILSLEQYFASPEMYESRLLGFMNLSKAGGTWPSSGSNGTIQLTDGVDTVDVFIDKDTDIDGQTEPPWPRDIIAIGSQYSTSTPPDNGYEVDPRYYATDFLPPFSLPVELTSFTASVSGNSVELNWHTATEINNNVFEVQRNNGNGFVTVGSVKGQGTSTQSHDYLFVDQNLKSGTYTYRLKQVDFNGNSAYSNTVEVSVASTFTLEQNYPNPFNPSTKIDFGLTVDSKVSLKVYNVLGQEVASLVNGQLSAGMHTINFNASNLTTGVYLYKLEATGINGKNFSAVKKMMLMK